MPPTRTNLDADSFGRYPSSLTGEFAVQEAHQRLFGKGAKVSDYDGKIWATTDERAMAHRPRSDNYGQDIRLMDETHHKPFKDAQEGKPMTAAQRNSLYGKATGGRAR